MPVLAVRVGPLSAVVSRATLCFNRPSKQGVSAAPPSSACPPLPITQRDH